MYKKQNAILGVLMLVFLVLSGCSGEGKEQNQAQPKQKASGERTVLTVSAAASLQDALNEIKTAYEKEKDNVKVNFNFGGSGALQQQISQGAPVDLFFSAAEDKFDKLVQDGLIDPSQGTNVAGNELVLIVPEDSPKEIKTFGDLRKADRISIGTPETVPAGQYAKETMETMDIWQPSEEKIVYAKDVRQVLTYVETGNVDAGIVYKTDAFSSDKVKIAAAAGEDTHAPIIYPLGIIKSTSHPEEAKQFYQYLQGEKAMGILKKYGFTDI